MAAMPFAARRETTGCGDDRRKCEPAASLRRVIRVTIRA